ncbi:MAG: NYN domain-containing protein [Atopobiaceae bacterium]|jgi:predicted RNA-binding protein with PIN domain|nr:NYN domain-containing protein [Atopobiaceae bacterium]MCH4180688.1 NYN domain-containing protein [Atopobiaceae bacterium]MCH4214705.1 NYN domain-containing protein [Atopobiaceae bacterium]MCH4229889.1 NYN domain-containing protein [Atopobiaceae bacterium]MCH4276751.1 NYN domain-containing protein [Atopobiaceae bacterium]
MARRRPRAPKLELLLVDGYNVIHGTNRYLDLKDERDADDDLHLDTRGRTNDPFSRAREALVADVAAFAQGRYQAVIVYDGGGNLDPERPEIHEAGVRLVFSRPGETADAVIEAAATRERRAGHPVTVITSDLAVQATVRGEGVTRLSSAALISQVSDATDDAATELADRTFSRMTLGDRLDPATRAKLDELLGR